MTDTQRAEDDAAFATAVEEMRLTLRRLHTPTRRADALLLLIALSAPWDGAATVREFGWGWERGEAWANLKPDTPGTW
jgi:hypothetical protein